MSVLDPNTVYRHLLQYSNKKHVNVEALLFTICVPLITAFVMFGFLFLLEDPMIGFMLWLAAVGTTVGFVRKINSTRSCRIDVLFQELKIKTTVADMYSMSASELEKFMFTHEIFTPFRKAPVEHINSMNELVQQSSSHVQKKWMDQLQSVRQQQGAAVRVGFLQEMQQMIDEYNKHLEDENIQEVIDIIEGEHVEVEPRNIKSHFKI